MSLRANGAKLAAITRDLSHQWQQTREYWQDARSREFERQYLEELFVQVDRSVAVIEELDKLVSKIRSDCE